MREGDWKLLEFHRDGRRELFNLSQDVGEKMNLVEARPEIARRLAGKLAAWRRRVGAVMPAKNPKAVAGWPGFGLTGEEAPVAPQR